MALGLAIAGIGALRLILEHRSEGHEDRATLAEQLKALGYVEEVTNEIDASQKGVVFHDASRASPGVNIYCSVHGRRLRFMDMDGRELHVITLPEPGEGADCMFEPYGERSFLALSWPTLTLVDWDSRVVWTTREGYNHDFSVDGEGRIWSLVQQGTILHERGHTLPIADHALVRLSPRGTVEWRLLLSDLFASLVPEERLAQAEKILETADPNSAEWAAASDLFHFNTVEVLDRDLAVARRGDVLLCSRELGLVAIVDPEKRAVVWSWGAGVLDGPHHPSVLPNGHLLIFGNGRRRGWSRLIEVEPATGRIVWQYRGKPRKSFSSPVRGGAQLLPNGNVLVTESTRGRVFEVTRDGSIVWQFLNPDFRDGSRRQIYRMQRVPRERYAAWAGAAAEPDSPAPGDGPQ